MVSLVEEVTGDLSQLEKDLREAVTAPKQEPAKSEDKTVEQPTSEEEKLPTKLRGKSLEEIADIYRNLESSYGRMANDLGQQRQLTDRLLNLKREDDLSKNKPAPIKVEGTDLLNDPTATLDRYLEARDQTRESATAQRLAQIEQTIAAQKFVERHSDYDELAKSPELQEWLKATTYRQRLSAQAVQGDFSAADELLTEFKASRPVQKSKQQGDEVEAARQAGLETTTTGSESAKKPGKVYKRNDLLRLQLEKPSVYYDDAFQQEILLAYSQGRVK